MVAVVGGSGGGDLRAAWIGCCLLSWGGAVMSGSAHDLFVDESHVDRLAGWSVGLLAGGLFRRKPFFLRQLIGREADRF